MLRAIRALFWMFWHMHMIMYPQTHVRAHTNTPPHTHTHPQAGCPAQSPVGETTRQVQVKDTSPNQGLFTKSLHFTGSTHRRPFGVQMIQLWWQVSALPCLEAWVPHVSAGLYKQQMLWFRIRILNWKAHCLAGPLEGEGESGVWFWRHWHWHLT